MSGSASKYPPSATLSVDSGVVVDEKSDASSLPRAAAQHADQHPAVATSTDVNAGDAEAAGGDGVGDDVSAAPEGADEETQAQEDDTDSAFGDDSASEYLSLTADASAYVFENGRRYHGYKPGRYMLPNDESEMDREDMKHHISMLITEGRLHLAPIGANPQTILDIGTGTGIWAIDIADHYPSAKIIATDLSPIQPHWVPPNLVFEIDDAEEEWLYRPKSVDLIHARYLFHGIRDWPRLLRQALRTLKPGGYVELVEMHVIPSSPDNTLPPDSHIRALYDVLFSVGRTIGIDLAVAQKFKSMMLEAGFEDVTETVFDLPLGDWMPDRRMKEVGAFQRYQMTEGLHGIAYGALTRVAGWSPAQVEVFLAGVRKEMKDRSVHSLYKLYFVYGRAPRQHN